MNAIAQSAPAAVDPFDNLSLRIRKSVKDRLIEVGAIEDRSVNYIVNQIISDFLIDYDKSYGKEAPRGK